MSASITLIIVPAEDPDSFVEMFLAERKSRSGGWATFPIGSGRYIDTFFMKATDSDLGVMECDEHSDDNDQKLETNLIDRETLLEVIPKLEALVEKNQEKTARALLAHGGATDLARVTKALKTGDWPDNGDPAEEAAAFGRQLMQSAQRAKTKKMGVCWEFRGKLKI